MTSVVTAEDVYNIIADQERLKSYKDLSMMGGGNDKNKFHMELPFDDIKAFVEEERDKILSGLTDKDKEQFVWEHVGSTAIKGMPGTMHPDAMMLFREFPPSQSTVSAIIDNGFRFMGPGPFSTDDLWFFKTISGGFLDGHKMKLHVTLESFGPSKLLLETKRMCNEEPWAFEDYKNAKVEAAKKLEEGDMMGYKMAKGSSKLLQQLEAKYGIKKNVKNVS